MALAGFKIVSLPAHAEELRTEIRQFLQETLPNYPVTQRMHSWMGFDAAFSKALGQRGWIGVTWPKEYGGQEQDAFCRYVLTEELLVAGAPVLAHWISDRQSGPLILRYGTQEQKTRFLPAICRGESYFCIGMSEPDSGSDLAALRTRATPVSGGWLINGTKLWTTNAHRCQWMIALVRTRQDATRHDGLSQFIIDLDSPGINISPIQDLSGDTHFNEVVFQDVFVPEDRLIGEEGAGWSQVMAELTLERSGPERYLSSVALIFQMLHMAGPNPSDKIVETLGELTAQAIILRQMSISIAAQIQRGVKPDVEAACVKDLGTLFEQQIPELAHALFLEEPRVSGGSDYAQVLAYLTQVAPSFSLRGGSREILRGIIARELGVR